MSSSSAVKADWCLTNRWLAIVIRSERVSIFSISLGLNLSDLSHTCENIIHSSTTRELLQVVIDWSRRMGGGGSIVDSAWGIFIRHKF